ncbi:KTSC domain-containing protein [Kitasatospora sp. NPDC007106]|uniref:KTSC domain-containing protein n=1 Tax=Kitasatospora sp. NPDC007106 TaxID=3156914 RepID=UPI0033F96BE0
MELKLVRSSNLRAVGYDEHSRLLEIAFLSGASYEYFEVPKDVYRSLMSATSHGKFFAAFIRGKYAYRRVIRKI